MSTDVLSCCDGLFCICNQWGEEFVIWNPLVRKYRKLPSERTKKPYGFSNSWPISLALGYDKHNGCKIFLIWTSLERSLKLRYVVLDCSVGKKLRARSVILFQWPNKEWSICSDSVFSNGALHWLVAEEG